MTFTPADFCIGESGIWFFSLMWEHGTDQALMEFLDDRNIVAAPAIKVENMSEMTQRIPGLAKGLWSYTDEWDRAETNTLVAEMFLGETATETTPAPAFQEGLSGKNENKSCS